MRESLLYYSAAIRLSQHLGIQNDPPEREQMVETAASDSLRTDFSLLIDGELTRGSGDLDVINPATGAVFARCPKAAAAELDRAVAAARRAGPAWRQLGFEARAAVIGRLADVLRENQDSLAELLTLEQGKPIGQSRAEIDRGAAQSEGMAAIRIAP
jgi:acyl-CoA reductase-like NAD-dependent aldehyde dehydrogenase